MSCQSISAKCAITPLINNYLGVRKGSGDKNLGSLGPCKFETVDKFLDKSLDNKSKTMLPSRIPVREGQVVVGMGDIHGDMLVFVGVLYLMGVINLRYDEINKSWSGGDWVGGNTIVVQCGDLLDRSGRGISDSSTNNREEVDIVQYMYYLNKSAKRVGGGVYWTLGNHDIARVWWKDYQGDDKKKKGVVKKTPDYRKYIGNQVIGWGGETKMKKLFEPGGKMAKYMAMNSSFILQVGTYVFMHGGITKKMVDKIYRKFGVKYPSDFIGIVNMNVFNSFLTGEDIYKTIKSMAWDRTWSSPGLTSDEECTDSMKSIFTLVGMDWNKGAFVLGHSIQNEGIPLYCKGRVWRIDMGMSEAFSIDGTPKMIGGIKVFMYTQNPSRPVEVLVVMNYSKGGKKEYVDKFTLYVHRKFKNVVIDPMGDGGDFTKIGAYWRRDIMDDELTLQESRRLIRGD
jgi:hypothetical protein